MTERKHTSGAESADREIAASAFLMFRVNAYSTLGPTPISSGNGGVRRALPTRFTNST